MVPQIHALTVSVGYGRLLFFSLLRFMPGFASLTVVTAHGDTDTIETCEILTRAYPHCPLHLYVTPAFYENGAAFNKGKAMEEARQTMPWEDWILFFDADICPPRRWWELIPEDLCAGFLYSCWRRQVDSLYDIADPLCPRIPDDRLGYGYFQLFHSHDPKVQRRPLLDTHWRHAGNYDSNFMLGFGPHVRELPFDVWHLGPPSENWFGLNTRADFDAMMETRNGLGIHDSEKV